ncbi:hypothetical protein CIRG_03194 [Coccidioides immitis RMSCC 2394]|uniref:Uncharacterized protein n=1 Tax=Coccidioides immitis RMSCC 2394 TaxID=404692 RepID=A0A0J7B153_COCIT|nr:hypothetical protein CIRG_03194 [Coccidioides immitis RMSCC 2394]
MPQINLEGLKVSGFILSWSILENVILGTSAKSPFPRAMPCEISGEEIAIVLQLLVGRATQGAQSTQQLGRPFPDCWYLAPLTTAPSAMCWHLWHIIERDGLMMCSILLRGPN